MKRKILQIKNFILRAELKLILFFLFLIFSILFIGFLLFIQRNYSLLLILGFIVALFILIFILFIFSEDRKIKRFVNNFRQNASTEVVIILAGNNFLKLRGWVKVLFPSYDEIVLLKDLLEKSKKDFSFYLNASVEDVEKIMSDENIKEVYFLGHGDSHTFVLSTDVILYYCEFNNFNRYKKDFVHQVHCGTLHGKSLVDYVVPKKNKDRCFFFRREINSRDVNKELKRRIKEISNLS